MVGLSCPRDLLEEGKASEGLLTLAQSYLGEEHVVGPATAPKDLETTGDGTYCAPWSYAGLPAITLPSGFSSEGLPLGIQLICALPERMSISCGSQLGSNGFSHSMVSPATPARRCFAYVFDVVF